MNFVTPNREEINPFLQLLLLLAYAIVGTLLFLAIACALIIPVYGLDTLQEIMSQQITDENVNAFKIFQSLTTPIGLMALPALALAITERQKITRFYSFKQPKILLLLMVLMIMVSSMPLMEWVTLTNQKMMLPEFLKGVEAWMKRMEEAAMKTTYKFISIRSGTDFIINLIVIAALPAIGEELMFRGGIQRTLKRIFDNHHAAIWLTAILFSAIHLQFYGFVPRMLLAAGFGYLYYYGESIWYAVAGHFINNAYAVCAAFYMQKHHIPLDKADEPLGFPWYAYLISAIITIALFKFFKDIAQRERKLD